MKLISLTTFLFTALLLLVNSCGEKRPPTQELSNSGSEDNWIQLFNGIDLDGWDIKIRGYELNDNFANTFQVNDGLLRVDYSGYNEFEEKFGHLFYNKPFSRYHLRAEYRFVGEQVNGGPGWAFRNNGLMLHCQSARSMHLNQDFPISIEAQLLGGNGSDNRTTLNLCTPGTNVVMNGELFEPHCINSNSKTYHGDQWVTAEVVVLGSEVIYHIMEGDTVLSYESPQIGGGSINDFDSALWIPGKFLDHGYIAIQAESHPIEFRKIELLELN